MTTPALLSTAEVQALSGMTYRQLDWQVRRGLVHPVGAGSGSGSQRWWTEHDALVVTALGQLFRLGIKGEVAKVAAENLRALDPSEFSGVVLVREDGSMLRYLPHDRLSAGWVLDLSECRQRVRSLALVPA